MDGQNFSGGKLLVTSDHDRDSVNLRYVYPVVSRRAGGVSVGINLNSNNACNWRCIYCQVPDLSRGGPPPVDLPLLERELRGFLDELLNGEFMQRRVPDGMRRINDIALSGNGEPTSAAEFGEAISLIARVRRETGFPSEAKTVLITNGSLMHRDEVLRGVAELATINGEVWFKLDRASEEGMHRINDTRIPMERVRDNLSAAIERCPTWLQTCWFAIDGKPPSEQDENDYLKFLSGLIKAGKRPQGVLLYGLARPSLQPEAPRLSSLSSETMNRFAARMRELGIEVNVSV